MIKTLLAWSSGKDSAWALHCLRGEPDIEVVGLFTTVNAAFERVAMHGVRVALLHQQAAAAGLPMEVLPIPYPCSNARYEAVMAGFLARAVAAGVTHCAFGDLFLQDIRVYRERQLAGTGITPLFPLWGRETPDLAAQMLAGGLRAVTTCIDPRHLTGQWVGRAYDHAFLAQLPPGVDPCGERGEFHTFATDGPMFSAPLAVAVGERVTRDGFVFADLLPG